MFISLSYQKGTERSLLLYVSFPSKGTTVNWVVDMDTGEKWQVGNNNLEAGRWSPSGKYISFYTYVPESTGSAIPNTIITAIWVSDSRGNDLHQIFDTKDYPHIEISHFFWLTDKIILANVFDNSTRTSYVSKLNVETGSLEMFEKGYIVSVAPQGAIWLHRGGEMEPIYYVMNLEAKRALTSVGLLDAEFYFFSPDGKSWAYFCEREETSSISLCLADVSVNGVKDERKIISEKREPDVANWQYMQWSQDGKYIGFHLFNQRTRENRFHVIDATRGVTVYDWIFPTVTYSDIWSPRNDHVVDQNGILLDLKTGQVNNLFEQIHETAPSYVVDWRLIKVP
jgi:hypothetical protein